MAGFVPAVASVDQSLKDSADILKESILFGASNTENLVGLIDTLLGNADWVGSDAIRASSLNYRLSFSRFIVGQIRALFDPVFASYLVVAGSEKASISAGWQDIIDYWIANSKTVKRRNVTTARTPTSTAGTGAPTWRRLTTSKDAIEIESVYGETTSVKAASVLPATNLGEPVYTLTLPRGFDIFSLDVSGEPRSQATVSALAQKNSDNSWVSDASFEVTEAAASSITDLGSWTVESGLSDMSIVTDGYRESVRDRDLNNSTSATSALKRALRCVGNFKISRPLNPVSMFTPYDWGVFLRRGTDTTGNVIVTVGNVSYTTTIASLTAATWTLAARDLAPATGTPKFQWPKNFLDGTSKPRISIEVTSLAGTTPQIDLDAFFFNPFIQHNGTWWNVIPGSTPVEVDYEATFADAISSDSIIQKLIFLGYGHTYYMPSAASPSITDP